MMKKIVNAALALMIAACFSLNGGVMPAFAEENNTDEDTVFEFEEFKYVAGDINPDSYVEHTFEGSKEIYTVYDRVTGVVTDILTVETAASPNASNVTNTFFTKDKKVYGDGTNVLTLRFTASMKLYSSGSFRQFNGLNYTNVSIASAATPMEITGSPSKSCEPHSGGYPCTRVDFNYTANVRTTATVETSISYKLVSAGFTQTTYYYSVINGYGYFSLY